jgi:low-affinity ferrous iron transport protein
MLPIWELLSKPGARKEVVGIAPTQHVDRADNGGSKSEVTTEIECAGLETAKKQRALDRGLDFVVRASGSEVVFLFITCGLIAWALMGIQYYNDPEWQVSCVPDIAPPE